MSTFRVASLGSGSGGNCTVVRADPTVILIDCGFSGRETERRLRGLGISGESVSAILVTHEHFDHIQGVGTISRRFDVPVYASRGTLAALQLRNKGPFERICELSSRKGERIGSLSVRSVPVPHDAAEPTQFVISYRNKQFGVLTDTGHVPTSVLDAYRSCNALLMESNHDLHMLWNGDDPPHLKERIAGSEGHLSNDAAIGVVAELAHGPLAHLIIGHVSARNNEPRRLARSFDRFAPGLASLTYATQDGGTSGWISID